MVTVDEYLKRLKDSGLMSADDVRALPQLFPAAAKADNAKPLAGELVRRGKLTKYQATALWQGKHDGLVLGNYAILDVIGEGGMGTVFQAEHRRMKRRVALKVLSPAALRVSDAVDRFHREVEAIGKLNHRNIVTAHDAGEVGDKHFLVMEYVEGTDLDRLVSQQGPLPVEVAAGCILQAARGLEYAHARGVLHRDVKPPNLLLTSDANQAVVKLLDLGLAWVRDSGTNQAPKDATGRLTQNDRIMGTLNYMAPEQALDIHSADHRADIYSLGCSWYYLVAGRPIYAGESVLKQLVAHREAPIPLLEQASESLNAVLGKMVAKRPEDRYQSMTAVIAALEACGITDAHAGGALDLSDVEIPITGNAPTQASISLPGVSSGPATVVTTRTAVAATPPASPRASRRPLMLGGAAAVVVGIVGVTFWMLNQGGSDGVVPPKPPVVASISSVPKPEPIKPSEPTPVVKPESPAAPPTTPPTTTEVVPSPVVAVDPTGEYVGRIAGEPWGVQVRRRGEEIFSVRLWKGGLPGDGWDGQTTYPLTAGVQAGRIVLDKNARLAGAFEKDQLTGTDALGEQFAAQRVVRRSPTLEQPSPTGAVVLFDGQSVDQWVSGVVTPEGWLQPGTKTQRSFRDFKLHLEYRLPTDPVAAAKARCAVLLQGRYELSITDSFGDEADEAACAALGKMAPAMPMSLPHQEWQTLDVSFAAPQFDTAGTKTANARCTVRHNGVEVHEQVELPTPQVGEERPEPGPLVLGTTNDSGIIFRNLWIEETRPAVPLVGMKPTWPEPNAGLKKRVRSAAGMIRDEFVLVQTLPLDEFPKVAEWCQESGYRPVRLRPYATSNGGVQAAALWLRDGYKWEIARGNAAEVLKQAVDFQADGLWPMDVAGYGSGSESFVALFGRLPQPPAEEARLFFGLRHVSLKSTADDLGSQGFSARVDQIFSPSRVPPLHSAIWWKTTEKSDFWTGDLTYYEKQDKAFLLDISLSRGPLTGTPWYSWCSQPETPEGLESVELHGLAPELHLKRCDALADDGYLPVSICAAQVNAPIALQSCSVWHRRKQ